MSTSAARTRLGPDFAKLWTANAVSNTGDGLILAAGPLLLVSLTDDPVLVGGAVFVQQLPWLLFSLVSGALVDRLDRRLLVVVVNLLRALVVGGLAVAVWADVASVPVVYAALFLLGTGETLADNAASSTVPGVVADDQLPRALARLQYVQLVGNRLAAPPLGAALFVVAAALPYGIDAASFAVAALLIFFVRVPAAQPRTQPRGRLRAEIAEGLRWLWNHELLRLLALVLCLMNVALSGVLATFVLYSRDRLDLGEAGYGVLLTAMALGGIPGAFVAPRLIARFGAPVLLRFGLVVETCTHLSLALVTAPWAAGATLVLFGAHDAVWSVIISPLRHRVVPDRLRGRVNSAFLLLIVGGDAVGALLGGVVAKQFGITAPIWLAFGVTTALVALAWRRFGAVPCEAV
ncbi:MFS transporter [Umezawaea beigongshangensis]|uniref:MFS transporter n=1 Tax=Umezawaea beigongshangensis TaxID=2780383 RepID=UPI0018F17436|nr:MFS transporter [Umezawaea beigongshangensis]